MIAVRATTQLLTAAWIICLRIICLSSASQPIISREYFVAPDGRAANEGTESSPWPSVEVALENVGGGQTIVLLPGVYTSPVVVERSGNLNHPTVIKSQRPWEAIIRASDSHGIYTADGVTNVVIDGIQVDRSAIDGVKVGSWVTVRNCWIHHSRRQGISAHRTQSTCIEFNLIEHNGTDPEFDHGVYLSGTNDTIRCNVIRWNKTYGCQIYYDPPASSAECRFYNNLVYGNKNALTVWSPAGQTNYVFQNTLISTNYVLIADFGTLCVTNNILCGGRRDRAIWPEDKAKVRQGSNLMTARKGSKGLKDYVVTDVRFVNLTNELFWLSAASPARGRADRSLVPPIDFFGTPQMQVMDIGAFQFDFRRSRPDRMKDTPAAMGKHASATR